MRVSTSGSAITIDAPEIFPVRPAPPVPATSQIKTLRNPIATDYGGHFRSLRARGELLDLSLVPSDGAGDLVRAHRCVVSAASPVLAKVIAKLSASEDVVLFMRGVKADNLALILVSCSSLKGASSRYAN